MKPLTVRALRIWYRIAALAAASLLLFVVVISAAFDIDARYPVTTRAVIVSAVPHDGAGTRLVMEATKLRSCEFLGIEWFLGSLGGRAARVPSEAAVRPQLQRHGQLRWDDLGVGISETLIRSGSYAIVRHQCWPFWVTETVLYEGKE